MPIGPVHRPSQRHAALSLAFAALLVAPLLVTLVAHEARADTLTVMGATLQAPRYGTSAAANATHAFVFGGQLGANDRDRITVFDSARDNATTLDERLPSGRQGTAAVMAGPLAYVLGGASNSGRLREIVSFDPVTRAVARLDAQLPFGVETASAVFDGTHVYVFGGFDGAAHRAEIVRFDPATGAVVTLAATLPSGRSATGAAWVDDAAYVYGGRAASGHLDEIVRFDPGTGTVAVLAERLPSPRSGASVATDGARAFVFGGENANGRLASIVAHDVLLATVAGLDVALPTARAQTSAAWLDDAAFVFGGCCKPPRKDILRFATGPGAPLNLVATRGAGEIQLAWDPPTGGGAVDGYRVYETTDAAVLLATTGPSATSYVDAGLGPGVTRSYLVRAFGPGGEGPASAGASATTFPLPGAPGTLVARTGSSPGTITLDWGAPDDDGGTPVVAYRVYRGPVSGALAFRAEVGAEALAFVDSGLPNGATRKYHVRAVTAAGEGPASNPASAASQTGPNAVLPSSRAATSAVWDGTNAWIFGGWQSEGGSDHCHPICFSSLKQAVMYNPTNDEVTVSPLTFSTARHATSAVWDGTAAYVFGGFSLETPTDHCHPICIGSIKEIVRFQPASFAGAADVVAELPTPRHATSAAFAAGFAFVLGGNDGDADLDEIVRYDTANDVVAVMPTSLPEPRSCAATATDGRFVWLLGGDSDGARLASIVRYDALTDEVATLAATLPAPLSCAAAAWDGARVVVFGGATDAGSTDAIFRFDPATGLVEALGELPTERRAASAVWDGATAFVFGGDDGASSLSDIVHFSPSAPRSLGATAGGGVGEITLTWLPPASEGASPLTGYHLYRGTSSHALARVATLAPDATQHVESGLGDGATYHYKISAVNAVGESLQSNEASARTFVLPGAPTDLTAETNALVVDLAWNAPGSDGGTPLLAYRILRTTGAGAPEPYAEVGPDTLVYTDEACPILATCRYAVAAVNLVGQGPSSNEAEALGTSLPVALALAAGRN